MEVVQLAANERLSDLFPVLRHISEVWVVEERTNYLKKSFNWIVI